jgi:uroporphyrinogen-III decarboxylase
MPETPATNFELVLDIFSEGWIIGGLNTNILTFGTENEIADMVCAVAQRTEKMDRFMLSSPGGLHGNIPLKNLVAYFDARARNGFTPYDWKNSKIV